MKPAAHRSRCVAIPGPIATEGDTQARTRCPSVPRNQGRPRRRKTEQFIVGEQFAVHLPDPSRGGREPLPPTASAVWKFSCRALTSSGDATVCRTTDPSAFPVGRRLRITPPLTKFRADALFTSTVRRSLVPGDCAAMGRASCHSPWVCVFGASAASSSGGLGVALPASNLLDVQSQFHHLQRNPSVCRNSAGATD